jgi:hypothetical protein
MNGIFYDEPLKIFQFKNQVKQLTTSTSNGNTVSERTISTLLNFIHLNTIFYQKK